METFWSLLKESIIVQATLTLGFSAAIIYMMIAGQPIPDEMMAAFTLLLGFWFGSKQKFDSTRQPKG